MLKLEKNVLQKIKTKYSRSKTVLKLNSKIPAETTTPGIGEGGRKRRTVVEVNSFMIYLIHCKKLYKCHNVPPPSTTIKEKKSKK
jgi:hypothetical protein